MRSERALDDRFQTPALLDAAANRRSAVSSGLVHAFMHELPPASLPSSIFAAPWARGFGIGHLAVLRSVQRLMLRTDRGPMRAVWRVAYLAAARAYAAYVTRGERGATTYLRGTLATGEALPGLADIDVEVVVDGPGPRARVRE